MSHSFIVYQYGKVASTALCQTLEQLPDCRAYQCHFMGEEAFHQTLKRLCQPGIEPYFFEHSLGQLTQNIKAYRLLHAPAPGAQCTLLTLCRDPFDWFRSALTQEIDGHLAALGRSLSGVGEAADLDNPADTVQRGLELLMQRIVAALATVDSLDDLTAPHRRSLDQHMSFRDVRDFEGFLFLLGRYLTPHFWFSSQFQPAMGFGLSDLEPVSDGLWRFAGGQQAFLLRYESMQAAYGGLMSTLGFEEPPALERANVGREKPFAQAIKAAFDTAAARELKALTTSAISRQLGYQ